MTRKMTHKERILAAINHEPADQVPTYAFKCEGGFMKKYDDAFDINEQNWVQHGQDQTVLVSLGIDGTTDPSLGDRPDPGFKYKPIVRPDSSFVDSTGRIHKFASDGKIFYVDGYWTSKEIRAQFPPRVPQPQQAFDDFGKFYKQKVIAEDKIFAWPIINGFHEGIWLGIGYSGFARETRKPTGLLDACVDELYKTNLEICKRLLDIDSEMVIAFTDDIAYKDHLLCSPKVFDRFYAPKYKQLFNYIHKRGGRTMFHTDGDITELVPHYIDIGLDLLQGLEPVAGVDIVKLNTIYGDRISWNGNIDVSRLLWSGTPAEVRAECERVIAAVAPSNNLIFGPSTDIMAWHPVENITTLYETARAFDIQARRFVYKQ
jgi:uroporphyrinogen-III decarboxylase